MIMLTIIIFLSWMFCTFFELDNFFQVVGEFIETLQYRVGWKIRQYTRMEILVKFIQDMWDM